MVPGVTWSSGTVRSPSAVRIVAVRGAAPTSALIDARAIGVEVGDVLRDQDDRHQHRAGDVLAAEDGDDRRDGDEQLGTNLPFVPEILETGLRERVQPDRDRD